MTCPIIGYPPFNNSQAASSQRSSGIYFTFSNGAIFGNNSNNKVYVTVYNPGSVAAYSCHVAFYWVSSLYTNPTNFPGGYGQGFHDPTDAQSIGPYSQATFSITWSTAGYILDYGHLYAQARIDAQDSCPATPPAGSSYMDCSQVYNASDFLAFVPAIATARVEPAARKAAGAQPSALHLAVGLVNSESTDAKLRVTARAAAEGEQRFAEQTRVRRLLGEGGRWLTPKSVSIGLGVERVLRVGRLIGRPGTVGVISSETFRRLRDGELGHSQTVELTGGETRQGLIQVEQAADVRAKDFYVVEVDQRDDANRVQGSCSVVVESGQGAQYYE